MRNPDITKEIKFYGKKNALPTQKTLNAGNLKIIYESGNLRYISCNGVEIIRMIYPAVRDKTWLTARPEITDEVIEDNYGSFNISYHCRYRLNDIDFIAFYHITGSNNSIITIEMKGEALSDFLKNRIGFCVLHPIENCIGIDCRIVHTDGSVEVKKFPEFIDPYNPFRDIRSMRWIIQETATASLTFHGDIFETEDQRNWTDASFKTFSTPLDLPYPVRVEKGTIISQKIELSVSGNIPFKKSRNRINKITFDASQAQDLPSLGICRSTRDPFLNDEEIRILKKFHFGHYRTELYLFMNDWQKVFSDALRESALLDCPLELALFFSDNFKMEAGLFIAAYLDTSCRIKSVLLFHKEIQVTPDMLTESVAGFIRQNIPGIKLFTGTNCNFAQLNRARPNISLTDGLVFAIHPQEHASDNLTLIENLQAQAYTVESARQFADGKEIAVSPVTLQRRFNANSENFERPLSTEKEMPWQVDQRQMSLFSSVWTGISYKYIAQSGVFSVSYHETTGERGIMTGHKSSRWPELFVAGRNTFFPVYHVLYYISRFMGMKIIKSISSDPLKVDSIILVDNSGYHIILHNLNHRAELVSIPGFTQASRILFLDEKSFDFAGKNEDWITVSERDEIRPSARGLEITMSPYASAFIDILPV